MEAKTAASEHWGRRRSLIRRPTYPYGSLALGSTLIGAHDASSRREALMPILTTAFDAAGHESDQPFMVLAGFVSTADHWKAFDGEWRARLAEHGIDAFHMNRFLHPRHRPLVRDLVQTVLRHSFRKFSVTVRIQTIPPSFADQFNLNAYALAGRVLVANVAVWQLKEFSSTPIEYVFEDGDRGKGLLMEKMKRDGYPSPLFRPKTDRPSPTGGKIPGFMPLQAADILANRTFAAARDHQVDDVLHEFDGMPDHPAVITVKDMQDMEQMLALSADAEFRKRFDVI